MARRQRIANVNARPPKGGASLSQMIGNAIQERRPGRVPRKPPAPQREAPPARRRSRHG